MEETKNKIEALLFCIPEGLEIKKLARALGIGSVGAVRQILDSMKEEYSSRGVNLIEENRKWKFKVRDDFSELVKDAAMPELDKAVLETLAFIAWKKEATQYDIVKFRSNKAYGHIRKLKARGFIDKKRKGKTELVFPTKKFYEYFNLNADEDFTPESQQTF